MPSCSENGRRRSISSPRRPCRSFGRGISPNSLQVQAAAPAALAWADLGSGGGFPGLVTAIRLADTPGAVVHLIESDQRKCAFLREVSRETQAPTEVHQGRIETVVPTLGRIEAVSARALAPVPILLGYAAELLEKGAVGIFLKGERLGDELTGAQATDNLANYEVSTIRSATSEAGRLLIVKHAKHQNPVVSNA